MFVKGAPEILLAMCSNIQDGITREQIETKLADYQSRAMRTLAFAYQNTECEINTSELKADNLTFMGIVAISDPVRDDVPAAVEECIKAGIDVKIVTGDNPGTAKEIGRQIGLWTKSDNNKNITSLCNSSCRIFLLSIYKLKPGEKLTWF
mgnify:CR=1 FL=1